MKTLILLTYLLLAPWLVAKSEGLPTPKGDVILVISGDLAVTNGENSAAFDMSMLQAMPSVDIHTTTIWTAGTQNFTGVPLADLLQTVGVDHGTLRAYAINDYGIEIPVSDAVEGGPILAYLNNGKPMSVREKGPLWIIYPYDTNPVYQSETIYSRSIWQLNRIEVIK